MNRSPLMLPITLYMMDNQAYGGADHLLYMQVEGRVMEWVEAGSHIRANGWLQFDERSYRLRLLVQATEIEVLLGRGNYLDWETEPYTPTYEVGKLVVIDGTVANDGEVWWIEGDSPTDRLCFLPSPEDLDGNISGQSGDWGGRLAWSTDKAEVCLDRGFVESLQYPAGQFGDDVVALEDVAENPFDYVGNSYQFEGWITDPISPDYDKGYVGDGEGYYDRDTKLRLHLVGEHSEWIEPGQEIRFNATVLWSVSDGRVVLEARSWLLGEVPDPVVLNWGDGYNSWRWNIGWKVQITGEAVMDEDGNQWIERSGSEESVCLLGDGSESSQQMQIGEPIDWIGRLTMIEDSIENSAQFCIDIRP